MKEQIFFITLFITQENEKEQCEHIIYMYTGYYISPKSLNNNI